MYSIKRILSVLAIVMMTIPAVPSLRPASALDFGPVSPLTTSNASFVGSGGNDNAGFSVAIAGDVNRDGFDDLLIGAYQNNFGGQKGAAYLIYGKASGWTNNFNLSGAATIFHGENTWDDAGIYVSPAGDVNNDGYDDFLIGASGFDSSGKANAGKAYLFLGRPAGWSKDINISSADGSFEGEFADDTAGRFLAEAGDVNGDGYDDFLISSHNNDDGGQNSGKVYMMFGRPGTTWPKDVTLANADVRFKSESSSDHLGQGMAGGGDVNGDGYDDFILGAPYHDNYTGNWNHNSGKAYLFLGRSGSWPPTINATTANASFLGRAIMDQLGNNLDILEDVNGDGLDDVLVSAPQDDLFASNVGQTYIFYGKSSGWHFNTTIYEADVSFNGAANNDCSGIWSSNAGDVNGDGLGDFIIGAFQNSSAASNAGMTYLWLGRNGGGWGKNVSLATADAQWYGEGANQYSGSMNWGGGDVNGDGLDDIIIGAYGFNGSQGKAYLIFPDHTTKPTSISWVRALAPSTLAEVTTALDNDTLVIELNGTDRDPARRDVALVNVTSSANSLVYRMVLLETGPNTGIFRRPLKLGNYSDEQHYRYNVTMGNVLTMMSVEDPSKNTTVFIGRTILHPPIGLSHAIEDEYFHGEIQNTNGSIGEWRFTPEMDWLTFEPSNSSLSGIPDNTDVGTGNVTVGLKDGFERWSNVTFPITVENTLPIINGTPPTTVNQDKEYLFDFNSTDDGQGNITWTVPMSRPWLSMNHSTGVLNGTPPNAEVGSYLVIISVDDGNSGKASLSFTITVNDVNDRPTILTVPNDTAIEDVPYVANFEAVDIDAGENNTLNWSLEDGPTWLVIDEKTGFLNGTPDNEDVGSWRVNVTVVDLRGLKGHYNYTLNVLNTNDPPIWVNYPISLYTKVGEKVYFEVLATDPDSNESVEYGISSEPPLSISIDPDTGTVDWTANKYGIYVLNISATDGEETIYLDAALNISWDGPRSTLVAPPDGVTVTTTTPLLEWTIDTPGGNITSDVYIANDRSFVEGHVGSAFLTTVPSGTTSVGAGNLQKGTIYFWTVVPKGDRLGICSNGVFSFTVSSGAADNIMPELPMFQQQKARVGEKFELVVTGSDDDPWDAVNLTYSLKDAPDGMAIDPKTGTITWVPSEGQKGTFTIKVGLTDGKDYTETSFPLTVDAKTGGGGGDGTLELVGHMLPFLLILITVVIIVVAVAIYRTKKRPEPGPGPVGPPQAAYGNFETGAGTTPVPAPVPVAAAPMPLFDDKRVTIDDLFIIYRDGRLIVHHTRKLKPDLDHDIIGGMFTAIQEFVKQSLGEEEKSVNEIAYGDSRVLIEHGKYVYLAAAVTGEIGLKEMHGKMRTAVIGIEETFEGMLKDWNGETKPLKGAKHFLKPLLE